MYCFQILCFVSWSWLILGSLWCRCCGCSSCWCWRLWALKYWVHHLRGMACSKNFSPQDRRTVYIGNRNILTQDLKLQDHDPESWLQVSVIGWIDDDGRFFISLLFGFPLFWGLGPIIVCWSEYINEGQAFSQFTHWSIKDGMVQLFTQNKPDYYEI